MEAKKPETNIWEELLSKAMAHRESIVESTLIILGDPGVGKRSLVRKFVQLVEQAEYLQRVEQETTADAFGYYYTYLSPRKSVNGSKALAEGDIPTEKINVWIVESFELASDILHCALPITKEGMKHLAIVFAVDLATPWKIMETLSKWSSKAEEALQTHLDTFENAFRRELQINLEDFLVEYINSEFNISQPSFSEKNDSHVKLSLKEDMLTVNTGVPYIVVGCKGDAFANTSGSVDTELRLEFIQKHIRKFALKYGAAIIYTSAKSQKNCELLYNYILSRLYPERLEFRIQDKASVLKNDCIYVPAGWDSKEMIKSIGLTSHKSQFSMDADFSEIIEAPREEGDLDKVVSNSEKVTALDEQTFLKRLLAKQNDLPEQTRFTGADAATAALKALSANAENIDISFGKESVPSSIHETKQDVSKPPKLGDKMVSAKEAKDNPELIANFFQSLLARDKPNFTSSK